MLFGNNVDREVNVEQVADALSKDSHTLVDVREPDEWQDGHIHGAVHIPMSELGARATALPRDKPIYTMCHSGSRSLYAINALEQAGFPGAKSLAGGIVAWARAGKPITR
jgi:rhodanese-related sulfurtransferase